MNGTWSASQGARVGGTGDQIDNLEGALASVTVKIEVNRDF
jgi:hypothetical protein